MRKILLRGISLVLIVFVGLIGSRIFMPCATKPLAILDRLGLPLSEAACAAPAPVPGGQAGLRVPPPPAVTVSEAVAHDFVDRFFVSGTLVPRDEAMIGAQIDGLRIVELLVDDGDRVVKGQVLARLDRSQLDALLAQNDAAMARADAAIIQSQSQIGQYEAALVQAQAELERAKKLDVQIVTQATLDQRIAAFRTAQSQLAAGKGALAVAEADKASRVAERRELMVRIDRTEVRAPVAGIVSRRTAKLGAIVTSGGDALFRIIIDGAIELEADIPEQSLVRLQVGTQAKLVLPGIEGEVEARVRLISEEVDRTTRLGKVRFSLPLNTPTRIGSFASGVAIVGRRTSVAVPASAVMRADDGDFVQVVKDGRVELRKVKIGVTNARLAEAREGLEAGENVVTRAAAFLRPGDAVRPIPAAPRQAKLASEQAPR